jgi:transcriptional regulator with XRE-family HTH domain
MKGVRCRIRGSRRGTPSAPYISSERKLADLSLRQLAELTSLSNPYLSQIEHGLHRPSVRVLNLLSDALNVSAESCSLKPDCRTRTVPQAPPRPPWWTVQNSATVVPAALLVRK